MTVSGNIKWAKVGSSSFLPQVKQRVIAEASRLNREIVPRGATGKLQDSFKSEQTEKSVRFWWDAPYAKMVDEGTRESSGRYVPAIGKRLVNTALSPRRQVFKAALVRGYNVKEARAALTTPITEIPGKTILVGISRTPGVPNVEAYGTYTARTREIEIAKGTRFKLSVTRHELVHAVQHRAGEFGGPFGSEERAQYLAGVAARQRKDIGTHPGIKGQHFSTKMSDVLREVAFGITKEEIRGAFA
jgi:hypothetical protein